MSSIDIKDIQTPIIPQELWLIEQYIKPDYFRKMVDAWGRMVEIAESALDDYMRHIPSNYRRRELPDQPDIVWGGRVIPNFTATLGRLRNTYICIKNGDLSTPNPASIHSDIRGAMDFWHGWMEEPALHARMGFNVKAEFDKQKRIASRHASNISFTFDASWKLGSLTQSKLSDTGKGYDITLPSEWPTYRLNPIFQCATGEPVPKSGIYIPAVAGACANFLVLMPDNPDAPEAYMGTFDSGSTYEPTIWTLVERVSDTGGGPVTCRIVSEAEYNRTAQIETLSAQPGSVCPKEGVWFAPHLRMKEIHMKEGEVFPAETHGPTGAVTWYFKG